MSASVALPDSQLSGSPRSHTSSEASGTGYSAQIHARPEAGSKGYPYALYSNNNVANSSLGNGNSQQKSSPHSYCLAPNAGESPSLSPAVRKPSNLQMFSWGPQSGPHGTPITAQLYANPSSWPPGYTARLWFGAPTSQGGLDVAARVVLEAPSHATEGEGQRRISLSGFVPELEGLRETGNLLREVGGGEDLVLKVGAEIHESSMGLVRGIEFGEFTFATGPTGMSAAPHSYAGVKRTATEAQLEVGGRRQARPMCTAGAPNDLPGPGLYRRKSFTDDKYGPGGGSTSPESAQQGWSGQQRHQPVQESELDSPLRAHARTPSAGSSSGGGVPDNASGTALRHPPPEPRTGSQPSLLRTTQIAGASTNSPVSATTPAAYTPFTNRAVLNLQGDLSTMAMGWTPDEWSARRRLVQFWRKQEGNTINATFTPISPHQFVPNSIVVSCIFREDRNECFITSVDTIYLLEALVGVRFTVEEKNRIRRNLEGFRPVTVSKSKSDSEAFFKLIMSFPNPKPRNIEKDVKVFQWKNLGSALQKILSKYSATYQAVDDTKPMIHAGSGAEPAGDDMSPTIQSQPRFSPPSTTGPKHSSPDSIPPSRDSPALPRGDVQYPQPAYNFGTMVPQPAPHSSPFPPSQQIPSAYQTDSRNGNPNHQHAYTVPYPTEIPQMHGGYTAAHAAPPSQHARSMSDNTWSVPTNQPRHTGVPPQPYPPQAHSSPFSYGVESPHPSYYGAPGGQPQGGPTGSPVLDNKRSGDPPPPYRAAGNWQPFEFPSRSQGDGHHSEASMGESAHARKLNS